MCKYRQYLDVVLLEQPAREHGFKKERLYRVLLNHANGELSRYELARRAGVSKSWAYEYFAQLEASALIDGDAVRDRGHCTTTGLKRGSSRTLFESRFSSHSTGFVMPSSITRSPPTRPNRSTRAFYLLLQPMSTSGATIFQRGSTSSKRPA